MRVSSVNLIPTNQGDPRRLRHPGLLTILKLFSVKTNKIIKVYITLTVSISVVP